MTFECSVSTVGISLISTFKKDLFFLYIKMGIIMWQYSEYNVDRKSVICYTLTNEH